MTRRRGQIPSYGKDFRLEHLSYSPDRANRAYVLKQDSCWFIRSDKTSGAWTIYWRVPGTGASFDTATAMGKPLPTLGMAMSRLMEGIDRGFYPTAPVSPDGWHCDHERQAAAVGEWRTDQDWPAHCPQT